MQDLTDNVLGEMFRDERQTINMYNQSNAGLFIDVPAIVQIFHSLAFIDIVEIPISNMQPIYSKTLLLNQYVTILSEELLFTVNKLISTTYHYSNVSRKTVYYSTHLYQICDHIIAPEGFNCKLYSVWT